MQRVARGPRVYRGSALRVARFGKKRAQVIYQRSDKYVTFDVSTSRINRRVSKLLDISRDDSKVRSQTRQ